MSFDFPECSDLLFLGSVDIGSASSSTTFNETSRGSALVGKSEIPMNNKAVASTTNHLILLEPVKYYSQIRAAKHSISCLAL
eukprot:12146450-Ditylum_brightwellii.AAC.1